MAIDDSDFLAYLDAKRPKVDAAIDAALDRSGHQVVARGPASDVRHYLSDPLASFVRRGGKRVRPVLCLLGAEAVGGSAERAISTAVAVELFQAAALIHDDIADRGELRRGAPCLHVSEGVGVAVNAGDLALTQVFDAVIRDGTLDAPTRLAVLAELSDMARRTLEGQALDLGWTRDGRWDISIDDYLLMATNKTAYYSAAVPLACGALCGGGDEGQRDALRSFGLVAGLAFQLQDDLMNVAGDATRQGKDFRSDIAEGKRTLLALYALGHLATSESEELVGLLSANTSSDRDLGRAVELMERSGAISHVRDRARRLADEACRIIEHARIDPEAAHILISMAHFFVERVA